MTSLYHALPAIARSNACEKRHSDEELSQCFRTYTKSVLKALRPSEWTSSIPMTVADSFYEAFEEPFTTTKDGMEVPLREHNTLIRSNSLKLAIPEQFNRYVHVDSPHPRFDCSESAGSVPAADSLPGLTSSSANTLSSIRSAGHGPFDFPTIAAPRKRISKSFSPKSADSRNDPWTKRSPVLSPGRSGEAPRASDELFEIIASTPASHDDDDDDDTVFEEDFAVLESEISIEVAPGDDDDIDAPENEYIDDTVEASNMESEQQAVRLNRDTTERKQIRRRAKSLQVFKVRSWLSDLGSTSASPALSPAAGAGRTAARNMYGFADCAQELDAFCRVDWDRQLMHATLSHRRRRAFSWPSL